MGAEGGTKGWRLSGISADEYLALLVAYDQEISKDPYVWGATAFSLGVPGDWAQFDLDPLADDLAALYDAWGPDPLRTSTLPVTPTPSPSTPLPLPPTPAPNPPPQTTPSGGLSMSDLRGVDISNNQGHVDLADVQTAGYAFAIMKASGDEGGGDNRFFDTFLPTNWAAAGQLEMVRGAYHYARPSVATPAQSVALFAEALDRVGGLKPGDLVALDLEDPAVATGTSLFDWAEEWLTLAEMRLEVIPFLYTGQYYINEHGIGPGLGRYPLWLASYQATRPPTPAGWDRITIWQNDVTAADVVPGVSGRCDVNVFLGTAEELRAFGKQAEEPDVFDVGTVRDRLWSEASELEANGYPWFAQAVKSAVALSKSEK